LSVLFSCPALVSFKSPATPEIYTLSLHDALPIYAFLLERRGAVRRKIRARTDDTMSLNSIQEIIAELKAGRMAVLVDDEDRENRSEEHTSELQSRRDLVCRLLLEKKKKKKRREAI